MTKTDDHMFCRACHHMGPADYIESPETVTCAMCDSEDVILKSVRIDELRREREAYMAEWDRIAMQTPAERAAEHAAIRQQYPEFYGAVPEGAMFKNQAGAR
jgi:hypothetical protein